MAAIFIFSAQPFDGQELAWWEVVGRKVGHFGGYAALAGAWAWALLGAVRHPLVFAGVISVLYAASDEYHQTFVDGRQGTAIDVGIDALGIAVAIVAIRLRARRQIAGKRRRVAGHAPRPARARSSLR